MNLVATDLDGTLVDTSRALEMVYSAVGTRWIPNRSWREFATPFQHALKDMFYPKYLRRFGRVTPLAAAADLHGWLILTGASDAAVATVRDILGLRLANVRTGLSVDQKIEILYTQGTKLYYDDDPDAVDRVNREVPGCVAILVK